MIALLSGVVAEKMMDHIILDIHGVGYGLQVTAEDFGRLVTNERAKLYVHEHIREQSHDLFGFTQHDTQTLFEQLLEVKNVGPKVALSVLDIGTAAAVRAAIASGDVKALQNAKGVGKRAAEQIIVELRDKVGISPNDAAEGIVNRPGAGLHDEAVEALVALGYSPQDAASALQGVDQQLSVEARIKLALRGKQ